MSQVQWFPGHMAKAIRLIEDNIKSVDFVIECRDARAPFSTRNPVLVRYVSSKKSLIVLTKKDLADEDKTLEWKKKLEKEGHEVILVDVLHDPIKRLILEKTEILMKERYDRDKRRGIRSRPSRALIVGVPNVGKSTIINQLGSRRAVRVENRPGVTQSLKLVKVSDTLEIVDTPGVLWPKFENEEMGIKCALVGSIKETGYPVELISNYALDTLKNTHTEGMKAVYKVDNFDNFFADIARSKGFLEVGGSLEIEKARYTFIHDVQNGLLGPITWD
ncbi:MAG: ribosome biogenesis GTPase YlqF [Erysipelothrix sp.]|nr:ribosome biogenesis GTPase YlqF [Erysipelothrix sp.]